MSNLQLSLKTQWFEMTKSGVKTEDYREITPYWIKRFLYGGFSLSKSTIYHIEINGRFYQPKPFENNIMTLGYPKSTDSERILKLEHKGIEIGTGVPEWGAIEGKLYFIIKHGKIIE